MMREAGILLHITSLPGSYGCGDLGPESYRFVKQLQKAGQRYWQILPVNPLDGLKGYSPYSPLSAFAGNYLFISPELLIEEGYLAKFPKLKKRKAGNQCDYARAELEKSKAISLAYDRFNEERKAELVERFLTFCQSESHWLEDWALFIVLYREYKTPWYEWKAPLRDRLPEALQEAREQYPNEIEQEKFAQFLFYEQWNRLKLRCAKHEVKLLGDIPIYVGYNSADVWANPHYFKLTKTKKMAQIAGVPPDYFNDQGQLWNMPVYNWKTVAEDKYTWWMQRLQKNLELFDLVRLDHFRGFSAYWEVKGGSENAIGGKWVKGPGTKLFDVIQKHFPHLPFIAEDLGDIDQPVFDLRDRYKLPGMRVLQFAFEGDVAKSEFIPHNYVPNSIVYTGTHDNNTLQGWFRNELSKWGKHNLNTQLSRNIKKRNVNHFLMVEAYKSVARIAIVPMQDILELDGRHRMNVPSTEKGNWGWRMLPGAFSKKKQKGLFELAGRFNRLRNED